MKTILWVCICGIWLLIVVVSGWFMIGNDIRRAQEREQEKIDKSATVLKLEEIQKQLDRIEAKCNRVNCVIAK